ncbi:MAG: hypothetical protein Q4B85_14260 [Lachnospiraceae bacterium]|nr:hypothetical protein [Lachnospiraceae bacterium]
MKFNKKEEKLRELSAKLGPNEKVQEIGLFSGTARLVLFFGVAIATLIAGRLFPDKFYIVIFFNILGMWMMVDAARVVYDLNNSCLLVTNKRILGEAGGKEFNLYFGQLQQVSMSKVLFLDSGDPRTSVVIRNLSNRQKIYDIIMAHKK